MSEPLGKKFDTGKLRYDLVNELAHREMVAVLTFGATKYKPENWRHVEDAIDRYYAAVKRHLSVRRMGEMLDEESGLLTLAHAACCIHFLLAFDAEEEESTETFQTRFNEAVKRAQAFRQAREVAQMKTDEDLIPALVRLLREAEWSSTWVGDCPACCPWCGGAKPGAIGILDHERDKVGHQAHCPLVSMLVKIGVGEERAPSSTSR